MPTPFDWTPIFGIEFRFSSASNPAAATSLNKAYSEIIGKDELSEFFVTREDEEEEEGPLEIAPDPQLHILNCIAKAIAINLVEPPPDEITKGHIANLLDKCVIKHHAIRTNTDDEPIVLIEITITHWRFKKNWRPDLFMEAYTGDPPSDDEVDVPDTPAATAPPAATAATVSPTEMGQLTTLLQQLVNNGNNNNNNATNNNTGANHQPLDLPWNPATLPPPVKERYYRRDEFLTKDDMKDFPITYIRNFHYH
eukprot:jgi/Psemu1/39020/gm1.39020_g